MILFFTLKDCWTKKDIEMYEKQCRKCFYTLALTISQGSLFKQIMSLWYLINSGNSVQDVYMYLKLFGIANVRGLSIIALNSSIISLTFYF